MTFETLQYRDYMNDKGKIKYCIDSVAISIEVSHANQCMNDSCIKYQL